MQDLWWKHCPPPVCENNVCKLLWDFSIVTDTSLQHNCPVVLKQTNEVYLIHIAIPGDSRLSVEKQTKYVDLKIILKLLECGNVEKYPSFLYMYNNLHSWLESGSFVYQQCICTYILL